MKRIKYQIINGDALGEMKNLSSESVDFVLTDLPFAQTAQDWDVMLDHAKMWESLKRIVKPDTAICHFASGVFSAILTCSNLKFYKHKWLWWKNRTSNFLNAKAQPLNAVEEILVFSFGLCPYYPQKSQGHTPVNFARRKANSSPVYGFHKEAINQAGNTDRFPTNVLMFNSIDNDSIERFHSNQKPIDLLRYLIKTYSVEGQTVLDIAAGSFSTGVACALENRNFIGIEINGKNCVVGQARIERAIGNPVEMPQLRAKDKPLPLFELLK